MPMIDPSEWGVDEANEPYALRDGAEVVVRIIDTTYNKREDDTEYYVVRMEVPSEPYSKEIVEFLNTPNTSTMDPKRLNDARWRMKAFQECFGIDFSRPCDPSEDWLGLEGWVVLGLRKSDNYGEQNRISKYLKAK